MGTARRRLVSVEPTLRCTETQVRDPDSINGQIRAVRGGQRGACGAVSEAAHVAEAHGEALAPTCIRLSDNRRDY